MEQKVTIPTSLADLTLDQYMRFMLCKEESEDDLYLAQKAVEIFCDVAPEFVRHIQRNQFNELAQQIKEVLEEMPDLITTFELDGVRYGFIPDMDKMSIGEFTDLSDLMADIDQLEQYMSILYRPITDEKGTQYLIEPYDARLFPLKNMPLNIAISCNVFFWKLASDLLNDTQNYGKQLATDKTIQAKFPQSFKVDGNGTTQLTNSLYMTLQNLMKSLTKMYMPLYINLPT
ncbi:hypothetical protein LCGC14_1064320 [marine sediment metagenome]|uniref:Uncharacterized protein n=1 Tax=marine sediment metagenome TaxID=412755 RepID=A0A0F9Q347_9ZZZZ